MIDKGKLDKLIAFIRFVHFKIITENSCTQSVVVF